MTTTTETNPTAVADPTSVTIVSTTTASSHSIPQPSRALRVVDTELVALREARRVALAAEIAALPERGADFTEKMPPTITNVLRQPVPVNATDRTLERIGRVLRTIEQQLDVYKGQSSKPRTQLRTTTSVRRAPATPAPVKASSATYPIGELASDHNIGRRRSKKGTKATPRTGRNGCLPDGTSAFKVTDDSTALAESAATLAAKKYPPVARTSPSKAKATAAKPTTPDTKKSRRRQA